MNTVILIGRLATETSMAYTQTTNTAKTTFTLAVDRPRRDGQEQGADFIRITVWGKQAENCDRFLSKGRQCAVQGRIQTGSYKGRDGNTVYTTDVVADRVEFLGGEPKQERQERPQERPRWEEDTFAPAFNAVDDGMPF